MAKEKEMRKIFPAAAALLLTFALGGCAGDASSPTIPTTAAPAVTARYSIVFDATWTSTTHPQEAPPNPHFSPLIGATHNGFATFWQDGALASEGIRLMAEQGRTSPLDAAIRAAISAGSAQQLFTGDAVSSPKTTSLEITMSREFPLVTLVTMVAPSPDWFVGVSRLPLLENGAWVDERVIPLIPWDAGTDSGRTFLSPDQETIPRQPISRIVTAPLAAGGQAVPLGTFRFTRIGS